VSRVGRKLTSIRVRALAVWVAWSACRMMAFFTASESMVALAVSRVECICRITGLMLQLDS
jgi:hypothetical protein